jgi:hypothetical protein
VPGLPVYGVGYVICPTPSWHDWDPIIFEEDQLTAHGNLVIGCHGLHVRAAESCSWLIKYDFGVANSS